VVSLLKLGSSAGTFPIFRVFCWAPLTLSSRPDHCDGGFDQYCDSLRRYSNISLILVDSGRADLLEYMQEYWKDFRGDDATLWEHEWNKHGTCISTLETRCYNDYVPQEEVVDYFDKAVELFQGLPSYKVCLIFTLLLFLFVPAFFSSLIFLLFFLFFSFNNRHTCNHSSKGNSVIDN
jgi:hypothetical protein